MRTVTLAEVATPELASTVWPSMVRLSKSSDGACRLTQSRCNKMRWLVRCCHCPIICSYANEGFVSGGLQTANSLSPEQLSEFGRDLVGFDLFSSLLPEVDNLLISDVDQHLRGNLQLSGASGKSTSVCGPIGLEEAGDALRHASPSGNSALVIWAVGPAQIFSMHAVNST